MVASLTEHDFDAQVISADRPVLVDFFALWCPPCRAQLPILDEVAADVGAAAMVAKVDVEDQQDLAARFGVRAIPTLLVFREGRIVERFSGLTRREQLVAALGPNP